MAAAAEPLSASVLSPAQMIMDLSYLASKAPKATPFARMGTGTGRWACASDGAFPKGAPAAVPLSRAALANTPAASATQVLPGVHVPSAPKRKRKSSAASAGGSAESLPPSVVAKLREMVDRDNLTASLPLFSAATHTALGMFGEVWCEALKEVSAIPAGTIDHEPFPETHSRATVEHDNSMLRWGIRSRNHHDVILPLCQNGVEDACEALRLESNQGPLHVYLTPAELQHFHETGEARTGECLECWRAKAHSMQLANHGSVYADTDNHRRCSMITYCAVNIPGGYNMDAVVTPLQAPIRRPFVKSSGTLKVRYDEKHGPEYSGWYIEQGSIVFGGTTSPLVSTSRSAPLRPAPPASPPVSRPQN